MTAARVTVGALYTRTREGMLQATCPHNPGTDPTRRRRVGDLTRTGVTCLKITAKITR